MKSVIAFALLSALLATPAAAQGGDAKAELGKLKPKDFPTGPIEYTVVYPAGGGMDVTARLLAKYVEKWSGDKIVVTIVPAAPEWSVTPISPRRRSPTDTPSASLQT